MAREIKFRAKRLDNGEWIYGDLHLRTPHAHIHSGVGSKAFIDTDTIGQFTGLLDKNGKEIYEGDIIQFVNFTYTPADGKNIIGDIRYKNGSFEVWSENDTIKYALSNTRDDCWNTIEMQGNIHDNPELLNIK